MSRVRRTLLNAATVAAVLLAVATGVLWVRSHRSCDEVAFEEDLIPPHPDPRFRGWYAGSLRGGIFLIYGYRSQVGVVEWVDGGVHEDRRWSYHKGKAGGNFFGRLPVDVDVADEVVPDWGRLGFRWVSRRDPFGGSWRYRSLVIPYWAALGLAVALPVARLRKLAGVRRRGFEVQSTFTSHRAGDEHPHQSGRDA